MAGYTASVCTSSFGVIMIVGMRKMPSTFQPNLQNYKLPYLAWKWHIK